MGAFLSPP